MGILGSNDFVECSASDLIGQYVGQTGPKTKQKLTEALGRVLFVDEAYRFCDGAFGKEAVNELVDCLTKPKFMGKMVVILAGYTHQIDELLRINPGLSSRFPEEVVFENMVPEKCLELLEREIRKQDIDISPPMNRISSAERQQMVDVIAKVSKLQSWGNGRDVKNIAKSICSDAFAGNTSSAMTVGVPDIIYHLNKFLKSQKSRNEVSNEVRKDSMSPEHFFKTNALPMLTEGPQNAPVKKTATASNTETSQPAPKCEEEPQDENDPKLSARSSPRRDPGVSDEIWQQLQANIAEEQAMKEAEKAFLAIQEREYQARKAVEDAIAAELRRLEEEKRLADERRRKEIEAQLREEQKRIEAALKKRREAERKRREEMAVQKKIKDMGICPMGFRWIKEGGGYRCSGGGHFLSNTQLQI
jgi:hypothetical protein